MSLSAPAVAEPRVSVLEAGGLRWIQLESPGPAEIAWLEEDRGVPLPELRQLLDAAYDSLGAVSRPFPVSSRRTGGGAAP